MGLTDDQKAMLRLLAQREEGYEDMAALMGVSVEEVRERVKEALAEVDEEAPAAPPPVEEPPAPPELEPVPEPPPAPPPPPTVSVEPSAATSKPRVSRPPVRLPGLKRPKDRGALVGLGAGALALLALVIVLLVGGDGGGSDEAATSGEAASAENIAATAEDSNLTQAVLSPSDGGDAAGRAIFGRYRKKVLLQVTAEGLEPSARGRMYTVWLYRSPKIALQIGVAPVGDSGKLAAQFEIPVQLLTYVANGAFDQIDVALTDTAEYKAAFAKAKRESKVPPYVGESVLRGPITSPAIKGR